MSVHTSSYFGQLLLLLLLLLAEFLVWSTINGQKTSTVFRDNFRHACARGAPMANKISVLAVSGVHVLAVLAVFAKIESAGLTGGHFLVILASSRRCLPGFVGLG